ncbi:hypothetical protein LG634_04665 [Streptomyces bambusae]|uniref:hypothetical protein n=1 Tax=Streptomyces bambusae TaxID=1550616 RepID=UPI001CFE5A72|nr:hypothetical protein [Streptomyces bambusae]MCB5164128.1 hypothetical protein [Streptomyces bambusae]
MSAERKLERLIAEHRESIRECLEADQYALLLERLRALASAPAGPRERRRALQGVRLALLPLPLDHPVRLAFESVRGAAVLDDPSDVLDARLLLTLLEEVPAAGPVAPETAALLAQARQWLLGAPALSAAQARLRCGGKLPVHELIALDDPELGARYPSFQFHAEGPGVPAVVREVNRVLMAEVDPWGAAHWWLSGNGWLGGTPAELLGTVPDEQLSGAARALVEGEL